MDQKRTDAIVVGGGLAGLAAAAIMARAGLSVKGFEKAAAIGGRASTQERAGFLFNQGPHALYRAGRGIAVLRELGVSFSGGRPKVSGGFALRHGRGHMFPAGPVSLLATDLLPLAAKLQTGRLLASLPRLGLRGLEDVPQGEWLTRHLSHPQARELVAALVRVSTYANDTSQSAGAALGQVRRALDGVLYLDGGWGTLAGGLRRACIDAGASVEAGGLVAQVARYGDGFVAQLGNGARERARAVVLAVPPGEAVRLLGPLAPAALRSWVGDAAPARIACLDVALRALPCPRRLFALGIDEPTYVSVHSAAARLAPEGGAVIHAACYLGEEPGSPAVEPRLERALSALQPGWERLVVHRRFLPSMTAANAVVRAAQGGLPGRPPVEVDGLPGAFVAGDWVGPEGMLADASLGSARGAASAAIHWLAAQRTAA